MSEEKATEQANEPNLIFVGLKINRQPIEFFSDGEKIKLPKASEQVKKVEVKTKDGTREEIQAVPFYHENAPRVVQVLGSRLYQIFEPKKA